MFLTKKKTSEAAFFFFVVHDERGHRERRADARRVRAEAASGARRPAAAGRGDDLGAEVVVVGSAGSEVEVEVEVRGGVLAMADGNCSCFAGGKGERGGVGWQLARAPKEGR